MQSCRKGGIAEKAACSTHGLGFRKFPWALLGCLFNLFKITVTSRVWGLKHESLKPTFPARQARRSLTYRTRKKKNPTNHLVESSTPATSPVTCLCFSLPLCEACLLAPCIRSSVTLPLALPLSVSGFGGELCRQRLFHGFRIAKTGCSWALDQDLTALCLKSVGSWDLKRPQPRHPISQNPILVQSPTPGF